MSYHLQSMALEAVDSSGGDGCGGSSVDHGSNRGGSAASLGKKLPHPIKFFQTSTAIKYSAINGTAKQCIHKRGKIMRSFTSRSLNFNPTIITYVAAENVPKNDVFHTISIATQSAFDALARRLAWAGPERAARRWAGCRRHRLRHLYG